MGKRAFLFTGQGSQEVGMGKDLIEKKDDFTLYLFSSASKLLNEDLIEICLNGPLKKLTKASILQASLVCVCLGYWNKLIKKGINADFIAGHSLGEITSLAAAGVVSPDVCLSIAIKRGQLMDLIAEKYNGGMLAVMFVPLEEVKKIVDEFNDLEPTVVIANYNGPNQIVLSGRKDILKNIKSIIKLQKRGMALWVNVAGPWHSPFMKEAEKEFEKWVEPIIFSQPKIPIIFNGTANIENEPQKIKKMITHQLSNPVYWDKCLFAIQNNGVESIFEIGPQKILSNLIRINGFKNFNIYNINKLSAIEKALEKINKKTLLSSPVERDEVR